MTYICKVAYAIYKPGQLITQAEYNTLSKTGRECFTDNESHHSLGEQIGDYIREDDELDDEDK